MTPVEIVVRRTGMSQEDAEYYVALASARVRNRLKVPPEAPVDAYSVQVVDIATLLWQQDTAIKNASASLGYQSHSFSEGGVSESFTAMSGQSISDTYAAAIDAVLSSIGGGLNIW